MDQTVFATTKAAIYIRVSTEEQKENYSIGFQTDLLRRHAASNQYEIYEEYIDPGFSGANYDRPAFQRLIRDAQTRKFDLILVYRLDRFFRNTRALLTISEDLQKIGVGIRSITEPFDTTTHFGRFSLALFGSIAQLEREIFIERSRLGRIRRAQEGYHCGSRPAKFGYRYNRLTKKLEIDERESLIVRAIFDFYNEPDSSLKKVAQKLWALGSKTKEGKEFSGPTVFDVLKDPIYIGKWYANRYAKNGKLKPRDEWIEVQVPVIVTQEMFNRAQQLLKQRKVHSSRNAKNEYLLQGLIRCGDCGCSIAGTADKKYQIKNGKRYGPYPQLYYRCTHFSRPKKIQCNLKYLQADILESLIWKEVEKKVLRRNKTHFFKKTDNLGGISDHWKKKNFLRLLNTKIVVKVSGEVEISCEISKNETESTNFDPFRQYSYGELSGGI